MTSRAPIWKIHLTRSANQKRDTESNTGSTVLDYRKIKDIENHKIDELYEFSSIFKP